MKTAYQTNDFSSLNIKEESEFIDFFSLEWKKHIIISSESDFNYLIVSESPNISIEITIKWSNIKSKIFWIFYSGESIEDKIKNTKILVNIQNSDIEVEVYLLSIIRENQKISVDGSINISKWVKKVSGTLLEENLVFWNNVSIKTKPILNIYSSDVQAFHWAKIEKIDTEKMFYLSSKWISWPDAENLILEWHIGEILSYFKTTDKEILKAKIIQN